MSDAARRGAAPAPRGWAAAGLAQSLVGLGLALYAALRSSGLVDRPFTVAVAVLTGCWALSALAALRTSARLGWLVALGSVVAGLALALGRHEFASRGALATRDELALVFALATIAVAVCVTLGAARRAPRHARRARGRRAVGRRRAGARGRRASPAGTA